MVEFEIATQNIVGIVRHIQEMSRKYNEVLQKDIEQNMNKLYDGPFQRDIRESPSSHLEIMDNSDFIFFNISEGLKAMDEIRFTVSDPNNRIDLRYLPFWASTVERYRWPITMALQSKIKKILIQKLNTSIYFNHLCKGRLGYTRNTARSIYRDIGYLQNQLLVV